MSDINCNQLHLVTAPLPEGEPDFTTNYTTRCTQHPVPSHLCSSKNLYLYTGAMMRDLTVGQYPEQNRSALTLPERKVSSEVSQNQTESPRKKDEQHIKMPTATLA